MLCERLIDPARLQDRRYIAEPKLDGQRAQLHVRNGRAVACYSRRRTPRLCRGSTPTFGEPQAEIVARSGTVCPCERGNREPRLRTIEYL
jgi:hypothetical protein